MTQQRDYRQLVERASDIIYETDADGFFTYANPVASEVVGHPIEHLLTLRFTELIRADVRQAAQHFYVQQARQRLATTYYEFPLVRPDGREVWLGQNVQLLTNGREITGFQAVARDMTKLRELDRFKDELIAIVSHELRTPLTAIRGALGLLQSGRVPAGQSDRLLTVAIENADRMKRLLEDFLDLDRARIGLELDLAAVDAESLVSSAVETVKPAADAASITVITQVQAGQLKADRARLGQALISVLSNAIKFSAAGTTVTVDVRQDEQETRIAVTDQGRGVPVERMESIFEPFRQVDQTDQRDRGGAGVGLAIAKAIVQAHRGSIEVSSELGRGTTFTIRLPSSAAGRARSE